MINKNWLEKYLSESQLLQLQADIANVEDRTSGEIRLSLREKRKYFEKLYKLHELAVRDFEKLGMANSKDRTGILIFIVFDEHYYDILADEGIYKKIHDEVWNNLESELKTKFSEGKFFEGIQFILKEMGDILENKFPRKPDDVDELVNEIEVN